MIPQEIAAVDQIGFPILSVVIFFPLLWALLLNFSGGSHVREAALVGALTELVLTLLVAFNFQIGTPELQFAEQSAWMPTLGITYHVGVDGISVLFLPVTALATVLLLLASWENRKFMLKPYLMALLAAETTTMGIFAAVDLVLFFVFWELALIPVFLLIKLWGVGAERRYSAQKYVLYMVAGGAPMTIAIILLGLNYHEHALAQGLEQAYSFDFPVLLNTPISFQMQALILVLMGVAFAFKGPLFPFHTWMTSTLMDAPVAAGGLLVGFKLGVFGFIRFLLPLAPDAFTAYGSIIGVLALIAIIYGALIALVQSNFRKLLAYASVSHVGVAMLGMVAANGQALQGVIMTLVNLAVTGTGLYLLIMFVQDRLGSTDLAACGGLTWHMPKLGTMVFLVGLSFIAMPGTAGFTGEVLIFIGAFKANWIYAVIGVLGVILSAAYFLVWHQRGFWGTYTRKTLQIPPDASGRELVVGFATLAVILYIGLYPTPMLDMTSASVQKLVERVEQGATQDVVANGGPRHGHPPRPLSVELASVGAPN
ncbi:MAG: NADH-quinone oxidoreductase subunit M [Proteobacteria bacterium]|nr:NADH-quinone oxidoreductase subunit M [Pseudomonadota bacterium]